MEGFTPWAALAGGALIGLAALLLLLCNGRIAGISGILGGSLEPKRGDLLWRVLFFFGLLTGGLVTLWWLPGALDIRVDVSTPAVILAGLLVGLGTRIGSGCTSGHGVCGVGRLAPRSIVESAVFVAAAMLTVYVVRHLLGGI
ncbi:MAG TPA: YeeE/YedE family protein [Acidiferrobacterales bacterium]